jgi:hypothetical protein
MSSCEFWRVPEHNEACGHLYYPSCPGCPGHSGHPFFLALEGSESTTRSWVYGTSARQKALRRIISNFFGMQKCVTGVVYLAEMASGGVCALMWLWISTG